MWPGVEKGCRILLSCGRRLHTKLCAHKLCNRHRLVLRLFLTWTVNLPAVGIYGLRAILLGPHQTDNPVSRLLD